MTTFTTAQEFQSVSLHQQQGPTSEKGRTRGKKQSLVSVMTYDSRTVASKRSIFGYISSGESVPEVMTTDENRSKTGAMASEASRQTRWKTGLGTVALSVSKGSRRSRKPAH